MARIPQVTRILTHTKAIVKCVDLKASKIYNREIILPRTYISRDDLFKNACKKYDTQNDKIIDIVSTEEITKKYGMTEEEFIQHATIIENGKDLK